MYDRGNNEFDEMLDTTYSPFHIGDMTFYASDILANCDPIAYRCAVADWDSERESEDA